MKIPPVSHSHIAAFEQCPRKYHHYYVLKDVPRETSPAMQHGKDVHAQQEERIKSGWLSEGGYKIKAELKLGMTGDGSPCDFDSPHVYCRGVVDTFATHPSNPTDALLMDWKTGKRREDPLELRIHGLLVKVRWPGLQTIRGIYVWLKDGQLGTVHDLSDTESTFDYIGRYTDQMEHQMTMGYMPPKQGPLCGWCAVKSCSFNPGYTNGDSRRRR